jgi:hypothetical protein
MPEEKDRPGRDTPGAPATVGARDGPAASMTPSAAALLVRVWREGDDAERQLKARLVSLAGPGQGPEPLQLEYAEGIDGIAARVRAWLAAFDRDSAD